MAKVKKIVDEHIARTDVRYYCPKCRALLWNKYVFPYPMASKCLKCGEKLEWEELKYYEKFDCYAINQDVIDKYCNKSKKKSI